MTGVALSDGSEIAAPTVVVANGAWAGQLTGISALPVRPVKGQILRLDPGSVRREGAALDRALFLGVAREAQRIQSHRRPS